MNIIVVGDAHAKPGISNERFTWLGRLINDLKPDIVLETGDWADMPSLSSYDGSVLTGGGAKKASFEGKRYKADVQASRDAFDRVDHEIRKAKKKTPHRISLGGNHCEGRINRALQLVPELEGLLDISELHSPLWEYVPFLQPAVVGGFTFQHYMTSGVKGQPIGGEYPATSHLKKQFASCVVGHSHLFDESHRATPMGKIQAFIAGCYLAPNQHEAYAGAANQMWDRGLLYMKGVDNGYCQDGFEWITIESIRRAYR